MKFAPILIACTLLAAGLDQEGARWWSHIQVLADDNMEGRNTGSEGHKRAAQYVAGQFDSLGLQPGGTQGFIQPVGFNVTEIDEPHSSLAIVKKGKVQPLKLGEDAILAVRDSLAPSIDAPAVFVAYGLSIPEAHYDDFAGLDLKGKILVYLAGGPSNIPSALRAHYSSRAERWKAMEKAGAVGYVEIPNPKSMDIPWARATLARFMPTMSLADPKFEEIHGLKFAARMNPAHADKILADGGTPLEELLMLVDNKLPLPKFPLNLNFRAKVAIKKSQVESQNVAAVLPGSDAALKNEYVVFSAHLDHVGIGQPINGDRIYNGAMDDASGVASLIEIANMMKAQKARPKRSVLFVAVTGEEKGLLGSRYFSLNPTVPKQNIVADINMDMFLPLFPLHFLEVQGLAESTLGDDIRAVCEKAGVAVQADKEPDRNLFIRSDQYNFIRQGIPALAFKFGYVPGSPEETIAKTWLKERYHAPSDDLNQPVDKAAAAQFNRILTELGNRVANAKDRPQWKETSFFKRFATLM
jgi:Peptidase family M28